MACTVQHFSFSTQLNVLFNAPVIVVNYNEAPAATTKRNLIITVVPPVGERLSINHITEYHHIPVQQKQSVTLGLVEQCGMPELQNAPTWSGAICVHKPSHHRM